MEPNEVVRYLTSQIEKRKEILKIAYGSEEAKRKKIESWIDTEMLAKLLKLKEKKEVERAEGEHNYDVLKPGPSGKKTYPRCDLWWEKNKSRYPKEVQETSIPDLPKTEHGKQHQPFPESLETWNQF